MSYLPNSRESFSQMSCEGKKYLFVACGSGAEHEDGEPKGKNLFFDPCTHGSSSSRRGRVGTAKPSLEGVHGTEKLRRQ